MRAFRSLLIWMMLAMLPGQGVLAAAMLPLVPGCAPSHAQAAGMQAAAPMDATHAMHPADGMAMPCHHAAPAAALPATHDGASHLHGASIHCPDGHAKCGACQACCAALALAPMPALPPHGAGASHIVVPFRAGHVTSADLALPERPPRPSLA